jgi:uncharacterized protein (DUF4213/DUF364 family)
MQIDSFFASASCLAAGSKEEHLDFHEQQQTMNVCSMTSAMIGNNLSGCV